MSEENNDVDLYDELKKTLESAEEDDASGASAQKEPKEFDVLDSENEKKDKGTKEPAEDDGAELSEEEISKLSPRAQKRIREQAAEVKRLTEEAAKKPEDPAPKEEKTPSDDDQKKSDSPNFKNVHEFLAAVKDEPSRKLLETFYHVVKGEISQTLSPIEKQNQETLFETQYAPLKDIAGLADYKDDMKKTFMRDPSKTVKSIAAEIVLDLQTSKVKPVERTPSNPSHGGGKVNLDGMDKEDLYGLLAQGID